MTILSPEDRARRIVLDFSGKTFSDSKEAEEWLRRRIAYAIEADRREVAYENDATQSIEARFAKLIGTA